MLYSIRDVCVECADMAQDVCETSANLVEHLKCRWCAPGHHEWCYTLTCRQRNQALHWSALQWLSWEIKTWFTQTGRHQNAGVCITLACVSMRGLVIKMHLEAPVEEGGNQGLYLPVRKLADSLLSTFCFVIATVQWKNKEEPVWRGCLYPPLSRSPWHVR